MLEGIDVSVYQAATPDLTGRSFLFARASVGTNGDGRYTQHVLTAQAAGLVVGAYHFGYTGNIAGQVQTFLDHAGDVDLYVLDVEGPQAPAPAEAAAFISAVQDAGHVCGLYHSESGFFDAGQDFDWVANWSGPPSRAWDFWQYRGSPLDLDRYHGTLDELHYLVGRPPVNLILPKVPTLVSIRPGAILHADSGLGSSADNAKAPSGPIPLIGNVYPQVARAVELNGKCYWIAWADATKFIVAPATDCAEAIKADRAKARITYA